MPRLTSPRTRLDRGLLAFFAGPLLLLWLLCAAAQAATLRPDLHDLALSFFSDADRIAEIDGTPRRLRCSAARSCSATYS